MNVADATKLTEQQGVSPPFADEKTCGFLFFFFDSVASDEIATTRNGACADA
jgi:hypothetical protein